MSQLPKDDLKTEQFDPAEMNPAWIIRYAFLALVFTLVLACLATGAEAKAENGKLIDSTLVTFKEETYERMSTFWPEGRTALAGVEFRRITYLSDGLRVRGFLVLPKAGHSEKSPCVIFNRGGNREFGALEAMRVAVTLGRFATWGYVTVASQYRGNGGGEGHEEFGGSDVNDVLNLIPLLESIPQADADRIGMYGWSRGGMMTYQAMARTDRIAAAVVGAGVTDQFDSVERRPEMEKYVLSELIPDFANNREAELVKRSAVRWPEKLHKQTPLLILHGSADWRVHPSQSLQLVTKLLETKHPLRFVLFEGGDHGLSEHRAEVNRIGKDWLDHYVRDGKEWPSLAVAQK